MLLLVLPACRVVLHTFCLFVHYQHPQEIEAKGRLAQEAYLHDSAVFLARLQVGRVMCVQQHDDLSASLRVCCAVRCACSDTLACSCAGAEASLWCE